MKDDPKTLDFWFEYKKYTEKQLQDAHLSDERLVEIHSDLAKIMDHMDKECKALSQVREVFMKNKEVISQEIAKDFNYRLAFFDGKSAIINGLMEKVVSKKEGRAIVREQQGAKGLAQSKKFLTADGEGKSRKKRIRRL